MKALSFFFAVISVGLGLWAARLWLKASRTNVRPHYADGNFRLNEIPISQNPSAWIESIDLTLRKAGAENALAAKYTAASVAMSAVATLLTNLA